MAIKPYAEVIVDVKAKKVDKVFHYRVPQKLLGRVTEGMRVIVPFGRRTVEGYILGFCDTPETAGREIKEITDIIDEEPLLNHDLLTVARWMVDRYMCSMVDAIHAMMPAGFRKVRPRFIQTIDLDVRGEELNDLIAALSVKAPKQAAVLKTVLAGGAFTGAELARLSGTTPSTVRELIKKGLLVTRQTAVRRDPYALRSFPETEPLNPTSEQKKALRKITGALDRGKHETFLLHGVTGSGKTEVYLQAIAHCLAKGRQAIVLVPEISLTPQMVERFKGRFGSLVAVLHSRLSTGERYDEWQQIKAGRVKVVVGARSAVFAPFADPGLIIIDEEHETSYKQEDNPKYHAREVAVARARLSGSAVILGSATPSLESYSRAVAGRYTLLNLNCRVSGRSLPVVNIVDLREEMHAGHRGIFSRLLLEQTQGVLERGEQAILFLNRRGYSTFVVCRECGLVMRCPKCSITLTLHAGDNVLRCHYCDFRRQAPDICPKCGSQSIRHFGVGTQKVEEEAAKCFPGAGVARMDTDTTT
ncbi:MAG: primosomal protein N', partial [Eubacteriales bacterium]